MNMLARALEGMPLPLPLSYLDFVAAKALAVPEQGFTLDDLGEAGAVHPLLHRHQPVLVDWMVRQGRAALFANFGLGKTMIQLEVMRQVGEAVSRQSTYQGAGYPICLIIIPLTVATEFKRDAAKLGVEVLFVRTTAEITAAFAQGFRGVYLTNYESVREGKIDTSILTAVSLDEASCLRGFGGTKTFREFMAVLAGDDRRGGGVKVKGSQDGIPYRFFATATPSPNEYIELLAYAAFLGVMDVGQAKTRFFKRNSEKADQLTIHPHKTDEFWLWVNSWAAFIQRPSDLGFSDDGYDLPELDVRWHEVPSDHSSAGEEKSGQGKLLKTDAIGVVDASREKRATIDARVAKMLEIIHATGSGSPSPLPSGILPEEPRHLAGEAAGTGSAELCGEAGSLSPSVEGVARSQSGTVPGTDQGLSAKQPGQGPGDIGCMVCGEQDPSIGELATGEAEALRLDAGGVRPAAEPAGSSLRDLPGEARHGEEVTPCGSLPPDESGAGIAVSQLQCGDRAAAGRSDAAGSGDPVPGDQWVIWCDLNDEQKAAGQALAGIGLTVASIEGATPPEERARLLEEWRAYDRDVILSKPVVLGSGMNLQQCNQAIFLGIGFKFNDWVQAVHRVQRFLQTRKVTIHLIYSEAERSVRDNLLGKWERHKAMCARMSEIIRTYGLGLQGATDVLARSMEDGLGVHEERSLAHRRARTSEEDVPGWRVWRNDTVIQTATLPENSVGLIVTSVPFSTQYEYTPSYNDFGHSDDNAHFFRQMDYLSPELLRVLSPGRKLYVHVKDRTRPGGLEGVSFQTVDPFHSDCIAHYRRHGFYYMGMITVETDVVRENNQTYRLGWTEKCKDGSRMSVGMPEYVLIFRKAPTDNSDGYADDPVIHDKADYTRGRWQTDAHAKWRSNGNRLPTPDDFKGLDAKGIYRRWREAATSEVYDYEAHVAIAEALDAANSLPPGFALLPPHAWHPEVWSDVARMRTLNGEQNAKGREMHLCPLQFDIVDRIIEFDSNPGDVVYDPFGGLMTVPLRAVMKDRIGWGTELNPGYFADGVRILRAQDANAATPSLFDLLDAEAAIAADEADALAEDAAA